MKFQIVVLPNGEEIKIPANHTCLAMDESGSWYSHVDPPNHYQGLCAGSVCRIIKQLRGPFEPGDWTTQLYYVC